MKHAPYPNYRPSGVEWLGEVPEHWEVKRLEHIASYRTSNVDKKTKEDELPVRLCNYTDVYYRDRIRASESGFMYASASHQEIASFKLNVGDVVITKDSEDWTDIAVPALVEETADDFVCGYHLGIVRPDSLTDPSFVFRAMQSVVVNRQLQVSASGVTRYGLPKPAVGEVLIPFPPLQEQRAIAAFLDSEVANVGNLIAKKHQLIDRLAEYRTALITRTVTRGLPPDVAEAEGFEPSPRLKPSGVDWLGEIPEHWELNRLKWSTSSSINGVWGDEPDGENDVICVRVADFDRRKFQVDLSRHTLRSVAPSQRRGREIRRGDMLLEKSGGGEKQMVGCMVLYDHDVSAVCSNFVARVSTASGSDSRFWTYMHAALYAGKLNYLAIKQTTGIQNLDSNAYFDLTVPYPPLAEQRAIAEYLDKQTERVDALSEQVEAAIERLQEYRTALVTAAVTGKIDVRDFGPAETVDTGACAT